MGGSQEKIRVLNDGATVSTEPTNMQKFLSNLHLIVEGYAIEARMLKIKYDSLLAVNFTEKQALELCKGVGGK